MGQKSANAWGLHDMHSNVWEWCLDSCEYFESGKGEIMDAYCDGVADPFCSRGSFRVFRGGGWEFNAQDCRSANRGRDEPSYRNDFLGFRVAAVPRG